jgi:serine/threonine-protein kinase
VDATLQDPLIGQMIDGRYRVEARIAVGGMATVYRALDTRLDRVLALKVMHPSLAVDTGFVERFIREAKSVARLNHPNVVSVTDQGSDGGCVYLAMEYVAGCTLRDLLREGPLQPRAVLDILEPVLAGLGAAHRSGLVHRDIKPENVLIGDDGRVKVADFGLVRGVDSQTSAHTQSLLGTVSYLAPEQIESGTVGPATDVYACGIMLYELLTGTKPYGGDSAAQVLLAHVNRDVPPPSRLLPGLAAGLDQLVARAAARDLAVRPADATALLSLLLSTREALTDAQLDAVPAAGAGAAPATAPVSPPPAASPPSEDVTRVVARPAVPPSAPAAAAPPAEHTARIGLLPSLPSLAREEPPPVPRARRRLPRRAVFSLIGLAVLLVGLGVGLWYINSGQFLRTPGVYGLPQAEAETKLRDAGLRVRITEADSPTVESGNVITTDPEFGERVRRNALVTVVVSQGPSMARVPELAELTLAEAKRRLTGAGLTPGKETHAFHPLIPQGSVIASDPPAGTERRPDSAVALTVSRGVEIPVAEVVGQSETDAARQLTEQGFEVETAPETVHSEHPPGAVAEQSPAPGEPAADGDVVTLTISQGPEMIEVPDVRNRSESEGRRILEGAGFEVDVRKLFLGDTIFNQSVHSGDAAPKGSTITIYVR